MSNALQNILGTDTIGASTSFLTDLQAGMVPSMGNIAPLAVGAGAGYFLWKRHRFLGALAGAGVAVNAQNLLDASARKNAFFNIAQVGGGVMGAKVMRGRPVIGFLAGWLGTGAALHFSGLRG